MDQTFLELLSEIRDFRKGNSLQYRLQDILLTGTLAIICNMDTYTEMAMFVKHERAYLEPFCDFSRGVPSHDTIGKVFSHLDAAALSEKFSGWMSQLRLERADVAELQRKTIEIDGKTIRRSGSKEQKARHVITAFASELELVLGQVKTDEKSNEITAIPELLKLFQIKGNIITIDAIGTQKEIAQTIIEREADYVLAVKGNQKHMYKDLVYGSQWKQKSRMQLIHALDDYIQWHNNKRIKVSLNGKSPRDYILLRSAERTGMLVVISALAAIKVYNKCKGFRVIITIYPNALIINNNYC